MEDTRTQEHTTKDTRKKGRCIKCMLEILSEIFFSESFRRPVATSILEFVVEHTLKYTDVVKTAECEVCRDVWHAECSAHGGVFCGHFRTRKFRKSKVLESY